MKRLTNIEKMESDGTFDKITKKEGLFLTREKDKLSKTLSGVVEMTRLPGALFVVDVKKETIAVKEAKRLGVPVFAIVDTNCDPDEIDYIIPGNDDALKTVQLITRAFANAILEGTERVKAQQQDVPEHQEKQEEKASIEESAKIEEKE